MKQMIKDAVVLFVITLVAGLMLGGIYQITKEPIARQEKLAKEAASKEVFANADSFEAIDVVEVKASDYENANISGAAVNEVLKALSKDGELLGYVITVSSQEGYGGTIQFSMGVALDGTVNGISILSISETAGLGMNAEKVLKPQFAGVNTDTFTYTKTGSTRAGELDAISGATITTKAFTNAANAGLYYYNNVLGGGNNE